MSTIAIVTATRAEYGLLRPFIRALDALDVETRIVATGAHLSALFGYTYREILEDGFVVDRRIPILVDSDEPSGMSKTMALALAGFADYFDERRPDALLVLGDRYETLAICAAAMNARIPIVHLYGGETTEGALDEAVRHCITKMAYLHLTSTEDYRRRVIQMGEDPCRVFNVGAVGIENALAAEVLTRNELGASLGVDLSKPYAVVTYHPVTLEDEDPLPKLDELFTAFLERGDLDMVVTKANADAGGRAINERLSRYATESSHVHLFDSLGTRRYLSAIAHAECVVGNSSSGLLEAPAFKVPTVNIGVRQRGRIRPASVIDCGDDAVSIALAIEKALSENFKAALAVMENPYGSGHVSEPAANIIRRFLDSDIDLRKEFYDMSTQGAILEM